MQPSRLLFREAYRRTPLIKFLGKRIPPKIIPPASPANEPHVHPASPSSSLPDSFVKYRQKAIQHGPLGGHKPSSSSSPSSASSDSHALGGIGGRTGHALGGVEPKKGEVWDRSELPSRFRRLKWTENEIEELELGGAGLRVGWGGA